VNAIPSRRGGHAHQTHDMAELFVSSVSVCLKLRIKNRLLVQTLPDDVDMKAVKHHG